MKFVLASIFFYSINNLLWKKILNKSSIWLIMVLRAFMTCLIGVTVVILFFPNLFNEVNVTMFIRTSLASLLGALGLVFMTSALQRGSLRQLCIFNLAGVFFTVTYLLLFENFDIRFYIIGTSLILSGFGVFLSQIKKEIQGENSLKQLLLFALMTLFFAASGLFHWYNLKQSTPPIFALVNQEFVVFVVSFIGLLTRANYTKSQLILATLAIYKLTIAMALLIFMAVWLGFLGLKNTNPFISTLLALGTPILTIVLAAFFYREKWNLSNLLSLLLILLGAFMLNFNLN